MESYALMDGQRTIPTAVYPSAWVRKEVLVMLPIRRDHPLRRLFRGLLDDAFCTQIGICDVELTDYLADLLVTFTHIDQLDALRNMTDRPLSQIVAMLSVVCDDKPKNGTERDRLMYRHIGDYTLFWTGVYPEHLKRVRRRSTDVLLDYVTQGRQSYAIVSDLTDNAAAPSPALFRHLSEDFECCIYGLGLVRRGWEDAEPSGESDGKLIY